VRSQGGAGGVSKEGNVEKSVESKLIRDGSGDVWMEWQMKAGGWNG